MEPELVVLVQIASCCRVELFILGASGVEKGIGGRNLESESIKYVKNKNILRKRENSWVQRKQKQDQEREMKGQADGEHKA